MPELTFSEREERDVIPNNTLLDARVANIELVQRTWETESGPSTTDKLNWRFTITEDGQFQGLDIYTDTPTTFTASPNCIAYGWTTAITGHQFSDGDVFDTDNLIGMPCRIIVEKRQSKRTGRDYNKVQNVLPPAVRAEDSPF